MSEAAATLGPDRELRRRVLVAAGAEGRVIEELLAYNRNAIDQRGFPELPAFPLGDEPHLEAWRSYAADASQIGAWEALRERFPQLRFPIAAGMSENPDYRVATRKGVSPAVGPASGLVAADPGGCELILHRAIAGTVPIIAVAERADFVSLVRAFCYRNEPRPVPDSMGACIVAGLNNWDRIHAYRRRWEADEPVAHDEAAWTAEFARLVTHKELYQDRFIILSRGPYSNVAGGDVRIAEDDWLRRSFVIRREHECTHYFTLRVFAALQNNLLEELIADFVGLVAAFGTFRADLELRFLGLEAFPAFRAGGRLGNYRGNPPLSDEAFGVLTRLAYAGVRNLEALGAARLSASPAPEALAALVCALTSLSMEELAAEDLTGRVDARIASLFRSGR